MNSDDHFRGLVSYLIASIIEMLKTDNAIFPNSLIAIKILKW